MKTPFKQSLILLMLFAAFSTQAQTLRYLSEVFNTVTVDSNIVYGVNKSYLTGFASVDSLKMDIYRPAGDTSNNRPVIILMHAGHYLPGSLTGYSFADKKENCIVELCKRFAKRGYVAVSMTFRIGWNPASTNADIRTGTFVNAIYRSMQDAKTCVRYFRNNALNGNNQWGIDPSKFVLGGSSTGAWTAMAAASLNNSSELSLAKFLDGGGNPYVNTTLTGNFDGFGGTQNIDNYPGVSSAFNAVLPLGGVVGDTSWIDAGEVPVIAFSGVSDPMGPFNTAIITTASGIPILEVSGQGDFMPYVAGFGNNNGLIPNNFQGGPPNRQNGVPTTPIEGAYPFWGQGFEPWNWYNGTNPVFNPGASQAKAMLYIDTIMGYASPRLYKLLINNSYMGANPLTISLGTSQSVCSGTGVTLNPSITNGTPPYTYIWNSTGSTLSCTTCQNPTATISANSTYRVTITDFTASSGSASISYTAVVCNTGVYCGTSGPSQCTASGLLTQPGFAPPASQLPPLVNGAVSNTVIQFKNFDTARYQGNLVTVQKLRIDSIINLPAGLCWASDVANNTYNNQQDGCIKLNGTMCSNPGVYLLDMRLGVDIGLGVFIPVNASAMGLKYFLRVKNNGDADVALDTTQTAAFSKPLGYSATASCQGGGTVSVSLGSNQTVCSGAQVTLSPTVSGGTAPYSYSWNATGSSLSCSNCASPTATITQSSTYRVTVTDANSATASASVSYSIGVGSVTIVPSGPTAICGNGSVTLGTAQTHTSYLWSNGSTASSITVNQAGVYTLTVTNNTGCSSTGSITISTATTPVSQSIIGNPSITPFQPYPYLVNATSGITYSWTVQGGAIQSGQGTNSVSVIWGNSGPYSITLVQTNNGGCSDTVTLVVVSSTCNLPVSINTVSSTPVCTGDNVLLIAQVGQPSTYQWIKNGAVLANQTDDTLLVSSSGTYQVQVTSGSCTVMSNGNIISFLPSPAIPVISGNQNNNGCNTQPVVLTLNNSYTGYQWSTGATSASITVTVSGSYTVTITGSNGCRKTSAPFNLNQSIVAAPAVCVVSVDTVTNKNMVIWEKPSTAAVDSYFVYKETNQFNVFNKIGGIGVNDFSTFIDVASNPQQQADRYKLAVLDTCGIVTLQSDAHKTIHLTINAGIGGAWNLIWTHYEGFSFPSYNIYRGTSSNGLQFLTSISSGNSSYTDLTPPANVLYYQVEAVNPNGCIPTAKTESFSSSLSNIVQAQTSGLSEFGNDIKIILSPNPAATEATITITEQLLNSTAVINDVAGRRVMAVQLQNINSKLETSNWSNGVYFVTLINNEGTSATKKLVVSK